MLGRLRISQRESGGGLMSAARSEGRPGAHLRWVRWRAFFWRFRLLPYLREHLAASSRERIVTRGFAGSKLSLDLSRSDGHLLLWAEGERFVIERDRLCSMAKTGETVVDVGANIGYVTLLLARAVGSAGRVYSIEPMPDNLVELRRNVSINQLSNIEVLPHAVGAQNGTTRMASGLNGVVRPDSGDVAVQIRRLDALPIRDPSLVKIDVEGYELFVLQGAEAWLRRSRPRLWVEIHPELVPQPEHPRMIFELLEQHGYASLRGLRPARVRSPMRLALARYLGIGELEETSRPWEWVENAEVGDRTDSFWLLAEA